MTTEDSPEPIACDEVVLRKFEMGFRTSYEKRLLSELAIGNDYELKLFADVEADNIVMALRCFVWSDESKVFHAGSYPTTWWDAVKERFAPLWFLERWPVRYSEVMLELANVYPNLRLSLPGKPSAVVLKRQFIG
jgi:hypothetical protein